ncbi:MAG: DUF5695 domain-containing protein [Fimbriimonadaceae bacterium]
MDDFFSDGSSLSGAFMNIDFGPGGKMANLWVRDPTEPEGGMEYPFILQKLSFGEEFAEDYHPGTVLLGARTSPDSPWVLSRNKEAETLDSFTSESVGFRYDFPLLPEIEVIGNFYDVAEPEPHIVWDLELTNKGKQTIELGELAFPMAFNNLYESFGRDVEELEHWADRVHLHPFVGGAASYLLAQRFVGRPPSLLITPGDGTAWDCIAHVPASLRTTYLWPGIPVIYVHSRAASEREEWAASFGSPSSVIMEAGDTKLYQMRFMAADRDRFDGVSSMLASMRKPVFRLMPAAVAPRQVGIHLDMAGATPIQFLAPENTEIEAEADQEGGYCFVRPNRSGPLRLSVEDDRGRLSRVQLFFTEPIEDLILARASWIMEHQVHREFGTSLHEAVCVANSETGVAMAHPDAYGSSFVLQSGLADTLFLAAKNSVYPNRQQIEQLERTVQHFILDDVQNPGSGAIGNALQDDQSVSVQYHASTNYPILVEVYRSLSEIASVAGDTQRTSQEYLLRAWQTAMAFLRQAKSFLEPRQGVMGAGCFYGLIKDLEKAGLDEQAQQLKKGWLKRAKSLLDYKTPLGSTERWQAAGIDETFTLAMLENDKEAMEELLRCALSFRSLAPSWWWYGSDKYSVTEVDGSPHPIFADAGENCHAPPGVINSLLLLSQLRNDYTDLPEAYARLCFGGMLGAWALVRPDGSASNSFCPDPASQHFGMHPFTGNLGISLSWYIRNVSAMVLSARSFGTYVFGCNFQDEGSSYVVQPWDGVGRRIWLRQIGFDVELGFGCIRELKLDTRKRFAQLSVFNPSDRDVETTVEIEGLWGQRAEVGGRNAEVHDGVLKARIVLPKLSTSSVLCKVLT